MKLRRLVLGSLLLGAVGATAQSSIQTEIRRWPDGKTAAVALTFDDNVRSQLDIAMPELEKHGYRGTFFVLAQWLDLPGIDDGLAGRWRQAFQRGHEIGSHSYSHAHMTLQDEAGLRRQLVESKRIIEHWIGAGRCELFRMPWGESNGNIERLVREIYPLNRVDLGRGHKLLCTVSRTADQVIRDIDQTIANRGVYLPIWHGVGGDFMKMTLPDFQHVLQYLNQHKAELWVAPQGELTKYAALRQRATLITTNGGIALQLPADMDPQRYSVPLALRTALPADWSHVRLRRAGSTVVLPTVAADNSRLVDYQLAPGETIHIDRYLPLELASPQRAELATFPFNSTNELSRWTLQSGQATVAAGALRLASNSRLLFDTAVGDGQIRGRFRILGDPTNRLSLCSCRLFFRVQEFLPQGDHNGIYYEIANNPDQSEFRPHRVLLWRQLATRDAGKFSMHWPDQLCGSGAAAQPSGAWHAFELTFLGERLCYLLNGQPVFHVADLDTRPGRLGLGAANVAVEFDDLVISSLSGAP